MKKWLLFLVIILVSANCALAATIHLKDGRQVEVLEVWETESQVRCRMPDSAIVEFPRESVHRVDAGIRGSGNPRSVQFNVSGSIVVSGEWRR
jgi:hypothetical protein